MLKTFTLKNGIKVATYSIPQMRSLYLREVAKCGSIFDTPKTSGVAHYMEHLLVQAIPSYPSPEELSDYIESLAGSYNAYTNRLTVGFTMSSPSTYINESLKIAGEVFFQPLFTSKDIEKERNAILEEIKENQSATWYKNTKFYNSIRYKKNHPFHLFVGGSKEGVESLTEEEIKGYWREYFYPHNTYLILVGNFSNVDIQKECDKLLGHYSGKKADVKYPKLGKNLLSNRKFAIRHDSQFGTCYLNINFPIAATMNSSREELTMVGILRYLFANARSSRLFRLLRQKRGLVYRTGMAASYYEDFGFADINTEVTTENLEEVTTLIAQELKAFVQNGITEKELENTKNIFINQNLMEFDNPGDISNWIASELIWEDPMLLPEEVNKIIEAVSVKEINQYLKKAFDFSKLNVVIQGPIRNTKENREKISNIFAELL